MVSLPGPTGRIFVWGWIPWIYAVSNRMPAGRFVALGSASCIEPSSQDTLLRDLEAHPPAVLIVETPTTPAALLEFLRRHHYQHAVTTGVDLWILQAYPGIFSRPVDGALSPRRDPDISSRRRR